MPVFKAYSHYYDLLNKDKDYRGEVDYLRRLVARYSDKIKTVLELGCGTGNHALLLQQKGFHVTGVDQSPEMLKIARKKLNGSDLKFVECDILHFNNHHTYDLVVSLFHVMSYMTETKTLNEAFQTAGRHLNSKGLFVFDCWHGPAVLNHQPASRVRNYENDTIKLTRTSHPEWIKEKNLVKVNFDISLLNKQSEETELIREEHQMRYWFPNEIEEALNNSGFELLASEEWLTGNELTDNSWNACYVAKKLY